MDGESTDEGALTSAELRALDRLAFEEYGLPDVVLMENAGAGAARIARALLAQPRGARVVVACGPGQNGGDGWVLARWLSNAGVDVVVATTVPPASLRQAAAVHARAAVAMGLPVLDLSTPPGCAAFRVQLARADLAVDALLGTGASGAPRGLVGAAVEALVELAAQAVAAPILALDLPSGLDADTGARARPCVRADVTATFAARKTGFAAAGAADVLGRVEVVDIGVPRALLDRVRAS